MNPLRVTADTGNRKPAANDGGKDSTIPAKVGPAPPTTGLAAASNSADENNDASIIEQLAILDPDSVRSSIISVSIIIYYICSSIISVSIRLLHPSDSIVFLVASVVTTSVAVSAEISLRSPRKLFIFTIKKYIYRIKVSKKND